MANTLYQTLNSNLPVEDLTTKQKRDLINALKTFDKKPSLAFLRLILEHSKVDETYIPGIPPYGLTEDTDERNIIGDLKNLPIPLRWILFKFTEVYTSQKNNI